MRHNKDEFLPVFLDGFFFVFKKKKLLKCIRGLSTVHINTFAIIHEMWFLLSVTLVSSDNTFIKFKLLYDYVISLEPLKFENLKMIVIVVLKK